MSTEKIVEEFKKLSPQEQINAIVALVSEMSLKNVHDLVSAFETTFGVSAAAAAPASSGAAAAAAEVVEEPTEWDVILQETGSNKVGVIKAVRELLGLGLIEAKKTSETPGTVLKNGISKEDAMKVHAAFVAAGATITVQASAA